MMVQSKADRNVKIQSLTVKDVYDLAQIDFDTESPIKVLNTLLIKNSSLVGIQNNIVGLLLIDILALSDLEFSEDTDKNLRRISSVANTYPQIFGDSHDRPELREEINDLYNKVIEDIQPDIEKMIKDKFKIYKALNIQPSELDKFPYWEYKRYLKML